MVTLPVSVLTANFNARNGMDEEVPPGREGDVGADIPYRERPPHVFERGKVVERHTSNLEFFDLRSAGCLRRR